MGDGTNENPYNREDVLRLIAEHGGTADGLDLSSKYFEEGIDLSDRVLCGIIMNESELVRAKFNGSNLSRARLHKANLERAEFNQYGDRNFTNLTNADLSGASLPEAEFIGAFLNFTNFKESYLIDANFSITGRREPDLHYTDFQGANLFFTNFTGRTFNFTKLEGAYINWAKITEGYLGDADWGNYIIGEEIKKDFYSAEHRYRHLKVWYKQSGYDDIAAKFYYREREATRKAAKRRRDRIAGWISWAVFGHGEGWKRIIFWIVGIIVFFAIICFLIGTFKPSWGILAPCTPLDFLYYSAVSFIQLGYGGWVTKATGWVKGLGVFETFLGFFMMTLLLVTFVRKWSR